MLPGPRFHPLILRKTRGYWSPASLPCRWAGGERQPHRAAPPRNASSANARSAARAARRTPGCRWAGTALGPSRLNPGRVSPSRASPSRICPGHVSPSRVRRGRLGLLPLTPANSCRNTRSRSEEYPNSMPPSFAVRRSRDPEPAAGPGPSPAHRHPELRGYLLPGPVAIARSTISSAMSVNRSLTCITGRRPREIGDANPGKSRPVESAAAPSTWCSGSSSWDEFACAKRAPAPAPPVQAHPTAGVRQSTRPAREDRTRSAGPENRRARITEPDAPRATELSCNRREIC